MDAVVATSTLILVGATCWMAWQSRRQADIARQGVDRAHRPVMVRRPDVEGGRVHHDRPIRFEGTLDFPVRNIGMGPALNVRGGCIVFVGDAAWGGGPTRKPVDVAAGAEGVVPFKATQGSLRPYARLEVRLLYQDVSGQSYWTAISVDTRTEDHRLEVGVGDLPDRLALSGEREFMGFTADSEPVPAVDV